MANKIKVAVLMGGPSSKEHEASLKIGERVLKNIDSEKYKAQGVEIDKDENWEIGPRELKEKFDIVFIALCGRYGENSMVQGDLEEFEIPCTGSDAQASAMCTNKYLSLKLLQDAGLDVPPTFFLDRRDWESNEEALVQKAKLFVDPPYVIKPNRGGDSFDMVVSADSEDIRPTLKKLFEKYRGLIVQPFIDGREVTCGVLDHGVSHSAYSLPPTEIIPKLTHFFDYESKYKVENVERITPARFSDAWLKKIKQTARRAHILLGCRGISRVDMIVGEKNLYVLEVNVMPGLAENGLLFREAREMKISYRKFIDRILRAGLKAHKVDVENNG